MMKKFLFLVSFITSSNCQFLQPRKLVEKMKLMQESSNKIMSREDKMILYVDISAANDLKTKEDFLIRVFNKDKNITLCEDNLVDYLSSGQYPCNFSAGNYIQICICAYICI
jgi:DNA-dependent RNA polymerase auxiliary subunit epsilon